MGDSKRDRYYVGVDVGTSSARVGLVDSRGFVISKASRNISLWKPKPDFYEQSSEDIWRAISEAMAETLKSARAQVPDIETKIGGLAFDATCSLVVTDSTGEKPITVSPTHKDEQNIVVWLDHRALEQTERINSLAASTSASASAADEADEGVLATKEVLKYVGGRISPEMETPKLVWLKENLPKECWARAGKFFDLADYLSFRATGDDTRSLCTTVCKWTFLGHKHQAATSDSDSDPSSSSSSASASGWQAGYFRKIGLQDLVEEGFARIGRKVEAMGNPVGKGLTPAAAKDLGLPVGTPVAVGIIDAHAGGIGLLGCGLEASTSTSSSSNNLEDEVGKRLAVICGTSTCHMAVSKEPRFIDGIWGPYWSAMIPGMWLTEGGQSATGALLDHIIDTHTAAAHFKKAAQDRGVTVYEVLNEHVANLAKQEGVESPALLTKDIHVFPDFHGNRSPRADPSLRGMVIGLRLSSTEDDLALLYLATIQAIAHGTRHIIAEMNAKGYSIDTILLTGGLSKNPLFVREHADVTGCKVILSNEQDCMLLGTGILAAVASGNYPSILEAMRKLDPGVRQVIEPDPNVQNYHNNKHRVFHRMHKDQLEYRELMNHSN